MKILSQPNRSDGSTGTVADLKAWRREVGSDQVIGLVPTMGALHEGHRSLISQARKECDLVAVTIFVNPAQFGPDEDLSTYPRTKEQDLAVVRAEEVDLVWFGSTSEMYPDGFATEITLPSLSGRLCGQTRPQFFGGVCLIVLKLFHLFQPDKAYFGEKDYQQLVIIERMTKDLDLGLEVVRCPLIREPDGLALSSRNVNLDSAAREHAVNLSRSLFLAKDLWEQGWVSSREIRDQAISLYGPEVELDYFEVVDRADLQPLDQIDPTRGAMICLAATVGGVRLIDNISLEPQ